MAGEDTAAPSTPASKARSTVRLRKLGHAATPQVPTAKKPAHLQKLTSADAPITFPTDSPVLSEQRESHTKTPGRRKKNASGLRGDSGSDHPISKSEDGELPSRTASRGEEDGWSKCDERMLQDPFPKLRAERQAERPSSLEEPAEEPRSLDQVAAGRLAIPCLQPPSTWDGIDGSTASETVSQPRAESSPTKRRPAATTKPAATPRNVHGVSERQARKQFEAAKREKATAFLKELDDTVAGGKLTELAASTGGVKLNWTNKLNTTAGRANWKRETVRAGPATAATEPQHRHHASIDIAEKVIDNEHRLLNVIAHEFCHLANFMISGVTGNPHGKEFKSWAAKCSEAFRGRGIVVTTKHSYDIDFKYIWNCTGCLVEYKRHSKSIDPWRHRCGACGEALQQIKPTPRAGASGKTFAYQTFVREQMKAVRAENPSVPQRDVMRLVAERWAASPQKAAGSKSKVEPATDGALEDVTDQIKALELGSGS